MAGQAVVVSIHQSIWFNVEVSIIEVFASLELKLMSPICTEWWVLGAVVKLSWCLCSADNTARVIKVCSTEIWMRMRTGCDSRCCSKCSPLLLEVTPSNLFFTLHLHFIARIAILFFLCIIFISFYLFAFALNRSHRSLCLRAVGSVMWMNGFACAICVHGKGRAFTFHTVPYQARYMVSIVPTKHVYRFPCIALTEIGEKWRFRFIYANAFRQYYSYFLHFQTRISLWVVVAVAMLHNVWFKSDPNT